MLSLPRPDCLPRLAKIASVEDDDFSGSALSGPARKTIVLPSSLSRGDGAAIHDDDDDEDDLCQSVVSRAWSRGCCLSFKHGLVPKFNFSFTRSCKHIAFSSRG